MFIQTISSGFKSNPTTLLFWKGLDVFIMWDTAERQIEAVSLTFPTLVVILQVGLYVSVAASVTGM